MLCATNVVPQMRAAASRQIVERSFRERSSAVVVFIACTSFVYYTLLQRFGVRRRAVGVLRIGRYYTISRNPV